jgi:hypothetical protein
MSSDKNISIQRLSQRKLAMIVGALFIVATVTSLLGTSITGPIMGAADYLVKFSANADQVRTAVLIGLINAAATVGIVVSLYPVLKKYNVGLALGAVGFRLIEAVLVIASVISLASLLTLSQEFVKAGAPVSSQFQTLGTLLIAGYDWVFNVGLLMVFSIGAMMYYYIFYKTKLIPRWLSGWGIVGVTLGIVLGLLTLFGVTSTFMLVLALPIAVQEMVMAVWLIAKGFNQSAIASAP